MGSQMFRQMTIIGVGLLGGSLAKACRHLGLVGKIVGFGRNQQNLEKARDLKVIDAYFADLDQAVKGSDLVVICSPVGSSVSLAEKVMAHVPKGCLVTDVGSVKGPIVSEIDKLVPEGVYFVGSHPIAGGETLGLDASSPDLLQGAKCVVTPTAKTQADALERTKQFWSELKMSVVEMDAEEHDMVFGAVSHLPHIVAYALINAIGGMKTKNHDDLFAFSGGGLKDITRIASSDPVMWRDIFLHNRTHTLQCIDEFQTALNKIKDLIDQGQGDSLEKIFSLANDNRSKLVGVNE